jgi:hypothetical protein
MIATKMLNIVLVLIGAAIIFLGLNIGLGGMQTLGWQVSRDFITVTDPAVFQVQDNHIRFVGGVWFGVGVLFVLGGFARAQMRGTLVALCLVIAGAGLFRFSAINMDVLSGADIIGSMLFELVGFPLLAYWIWRS